MAPTARALPPTTAPPPLPVPRGPISEGLVGHLRHQPPHAVAPLDAPVADAVHGEDEAVSLHLLYELHYRGFADVDDGWEWEPSLLALRRQLEEAFLDGVAAAVGPPQPFAGDVAAALWDLVRSATGPSLSAWVAAHGTRRELTEMAIHRSAYQLKEADPHTFALPRLDGPGKAAMATIQSDEYGSGQADRMHNALFARTMRALGLDDRYGAYLDRIPAVTLAPTNLLSFFALHRRWRGAVVGHLAVFEMTSVVPMGRYAEALRRVGAPDGAAFYDAHVEADAWHQHLAADGMAAALCQAEPALAADVLFGARALMHLEDVQARAMLAAWERGESSLRPARPSKEQAA